MIVPDLDRLAALLWMTAVRESARGPETAPRMIDPDRVEPMVRRFAGMRDRWRAPWEAQARALVAAMDALERPAPEHSAGPTRPDCTAYRCGLVPCPGATRGFPCYVNLDGLRCASVPDQGTGSPLGGGGA